MTYAIRHDNGTYYTGFTGIGPRFGGTEGQAIKYTTKDEAIRVSCHWAFAEADVVEVEG